MWHSETRYRSQPGRCVNWLRWLRLDAQARSLEQAATGPSVEHIISQEMLASPDFSGRSVFGWERASSRAGKAGGHTRR